VPYAAAQSAFPSAFALGYEPTQDDWQLLTLPSPLSTGQPAGVGFGVAGVTVDTGTAVQVESGVAPFT
jgi:hypothetical protein